MKNLFKKIAVMTLILAIAMTALPVHALRVLPPDLDSGEYVDIDFDDGGFQLSQEEIDAFWDSMFDPETVQILLDGTAIEAPTPFINRETAQVMLPITVILREAGLDIEIEELTEGELYQYFQTVDGVVFASMFVFGEVIPLFAHIEYGNVHISSDITSDATPIEVVAVQAGGSVAIFGGWEMRTFDDPIDQIYYNTFGEGFELVQSRSNSINSTLTSGEWQLSVISSIAVPGMTFTTTIWPENATFVIDEENWTREVIDGDTGEPIDMEALEQVEYTDMQVTTFLALQDTTGRVPLNGVNLTLVDAFDPDDMMSRSSFFFGHINFVHFDEDTNTAYFAARHNSSVREAGDSVEISFTIDQIFADVQMIMEEIDIDIADLLESHEATFITLEASQRFGGGFSSHDMFEVMGQDFDPFSGDIEAMERGELSIYLAENMYLTNIAVRDNLLHLQTSQEDQIGWPTARWAHLMIVDNRIEPFDWEELLADIDVFTATEAEMEEWNLRFEPYAARYIQGIFGFDVSPVDEDFILIGNRRYNEQVIYIRDSELINNLGFIVSGSYHAVVQPVDFAVSAEASVLGGRIESDASARVRIDGRSYIIGDFTITPLELSFGIEDAQTLVDRMNDHTRFFSMEEHIELELIHADGTVTEHSGRQTGWSFGHIWDEDGEVTELTETKVNFGGIVIDIDDLVAVRVNGIRIDLR